MALAYLQQSAKEIFLAATKHTIINTLYTQQALSYIIVPAVSYLQGNVIQDGKFRLTALPCRTIVIFLNILIQIVSGSLAH